MWNRSKTRLWITLLPRFTPLYLTFLLYHLSSTVAGGSPSPYTPVEMILVNCGSSGKSTSLDGRIWIGDVDSKFTPIEHSQHQTSLTDSAAQRPPSAAQIPYTSARLSLSAFTYIIPVITAGQKCIRLYFNPDSYPKFDSSIARFSVKAGGFTLLRNFSPSLKADTLLREYFISIEEDQMLNITFNPSVSDSHAFINGIEILSMPPNLYQFAKQSSSSSDEQNAIINNIDDNTAMEMVYRVNVGGRSISPSEDTGMFRGWSQDDEYLSEYQQLLVPANPTIELKFTKIPAYTAPKEVYQTARYMGGRGTINKMYNLTWGFPVDSGFIYNVRLHFCEFQPKIIQVGDRVFLIFIANKIVEEAADVIEWSGGNGVPVYRDYTVYMFYKEGEKKTTLNLALGVNPQDWKTGYSDAILNGIEIFKVNTLNGIPSSNPVPLTPPTPPTKSKNSTTIIGAAVVGGVFGFFVLSILGFLIFRRRKRVKESSSTNKSSKTKTRRSSLPSDQCRHFSLAKIKEASNNFDEALIIGVGGFGKVYKGYINIDGRANPVAIKRLTPGSQQGAHEFETEIEMLSQLRHRHLVSLIGYCNDGNEMILVYDFMAHGTLRDHLYNTTTDNPPLRWKQRLEICIDAARGLNYLHTGANQMIIHRDVKTTNILLDEKWVAKVSDFGLSKIGKPEAHVSTVVKGTFGYLDPEYYRRQQLSQKSDVYSFGVVLCEVLSARPPIIRTAETTQVVVLAEWAPDCYRNGEVDQIIDPSLKGEIADECLKTFAEIVVRCLHDNGINRPSMNDVVRDLELALKLQESVDKDARLKEEALLPNDMCSSCTICGQDFSEIVNLQGR
ncbi:receptor-like protein kinase FERONIA [Alnus glutinosa]|uniref:receptor-like protein kinase FERONIA n=1 Tax=Alnus glutinosa TaxID=3517 RepID=UPI002D77D809|nr:receptor-like protein kinase FERONIA [Alnus glutinosa]